jgi:NADH:ubiquinone oxidoreductase subunit K
MKGLMIGMTYCSFFLSGALWLAVSLPFIHIHSIWGTGTLSCGFWYILLLTIVDVGIFLILAVLSRWYKKRRRQDVLPNEHIFAERYYSIVD